jgi:tRNA A37 methylthiotransferase MiaB
MSILEAHDRDYRLVRLEEVWDGTAVSPAEDVGVVLLSTTFIWNARMLADVMAWIRAYVPGIPVVAGGQYTNLKHIAVMTAHPEISMVIRGDAECALPRALEALTGRGDLAGVPNLVWRDGDRIRVNRSEYVDLDAVSPPQFPDGERVAPYESMRGCPFDCKFCSFPAASPRWRYKSASKIVSDWEYYGASGITTIDAMDSTFTVPSTRWRELMTALPGASVPRWSCYSRANVITSAAFLEDLASAHCFYLVIGFESMSDATLRRMSKRVTAAQNQRALELLAASDIGYTNCFMVGYPGETAADFQETRDYLTTSYSGRFMLHPFSITDETMPLWADGEELGIVSADPTDPDSPWNHVGMSSDDARVLFVDTLREVRARNDHAVLNLWQREYDEPLLPDADRPTALAVEKAVERLAMAPTDFADMVRGAGVVGDQLRTLARHGVRVRSMGRPSVTPAR